MRMKKQRVLPVLLAATMILQIGAPAAFADVTQTPSEIYVNHSSSSDGTGTSGSPYKDFKEALLAAKDGDTIYLQEGGAYIEAVGQEVPFVIDKAVTIKSAGSSRASFHTRSAGIILEDDVVFENVELTFANKRYRGIFANGYSLTLNNVTHSEKQKVQIFAGTVGDGARYADGSISLPTHGHKAHITISGKSTMIGNIYAGSMLGSYQGDTVIELMNLTAKNIGNIYGTGAEEAVYDSDDFFDFSQIPDPNPAPNDYPTFGQMDVNAKNVVPKLIDNAASFSVDNQNQVVNTQLKNVQTITIGEGTNLVPASIESNVPIDVSLGNNAKFDLTQITGDYPTIGTYSSDDGMLVLNKDKTLHIEGYISETGKLAIDGCDVYGSSKLAELHHPYIMLGKDVTYQGNDFDFKPNFAQESEVKLMFIPEDRAWEVVEQSYQIPAEDDSSETTDDSQTEAAGSEDQKESISETEAADTDQKEPISATEATDTKEKADSKVEDDSKTVVAESKESSGNKTSGNTSSSGGGSSKKSSSGGGSSSGSGSGGSSSTKETSGQWSQMGNSWQFKTPDGDSYKNRWIYVKGKWYWMEPTGIMAEGWRKLNGTWYYLIPVAGEMAVGWILDGQTWYYTDGSGAMQTGWVKVNEKWYYLAEDGHMLASTTTPDGYLVDGSGAWIP